MFAPIKRVYVRSYDIKNLVIAIAATSALTLTYSTSANAGNVTDKVSIGAFLEVGGYLGGDTRQSIDAYHFHEVSADAKYHTDTAGSIRVKYEDGQFFGGVEIDAYMTEKQAELDKAFVGYIFENGVVVIAGLIDSVFDSRSSYGDLAVEFGKGAVETSAGRDVNGFSVEYENDTFYTGLTTILDDNSQHGSFNGAIDFTPVDGLLIGVGFLRSNGMFWGKMNDSYAWNIGAEYQATDTLILGLLYNQYRVGKDDESVDFNAGGNSHAAGYEARHSVDMDQWEVSGQYRLMDKLTVAGQISSRDYTLAPVNADTLSDSGMFYGFGAFYDYSRNTRFSIDYQYGEALNENMAYIKSAFYF
jgi:hypothetical protein